MRRAARTDSTQRAIVSALRLAGATVQPIHQLGGGIPDLLVATSGGETLLVECKSPGGKLTPDQRRWFEAWPGRILIVRDPSEIAELLGGIR